MLRKRLVVTVGAVLAGLSGSALAQSCSDDDLNPDVYKGVSRNAPLGAALSAVPCAPTGKTSYTDAIGRTFDVYTWTSPSKSFTVETFESRVFKKAGRNLAYQSIEVRPDMPSFDEETGIVTIPVLNINTGDGTQQVYDAQVMLMANGEWALLTYDTVKKGDAKYDTRGYPVSSYDPATGKLFIPNLRTEDGSTPFVAKLPPDGKWKVLVDGEPPVPNDSANLPPAPAPSFDDENSVLNIPALVLIGEDGKRTVVYDAKVLLGEDGGWALLDFKQVAADDVPYNLDEYQMPILDQKLGYLDVVGIEGEEGKFRLRAKLNPDGTWSKVTDSVDIPITTAPAAPAPKYDASKGVLTLSALTIVNEEGDREVVYDARVFFTEDGNWSLIGYRVVDEGTEPPYALTDYEMPLLDYKNGKLIVTGIEQPPAEEGGTPTYLNLRANLNANGTWTPMGSGFAPAPVDPVVPAPAPVATAPAYDTAREVVTMPALAIINEAGVRSVVYDAKVMLSATGGWALLDYTVADTSPYNLTGYDMPQIDYGVGRMVVVGAQTTGGETTTTQTLVLRLNPDGTWSQWATSTPTPTPTPTP